MDNMFVKLDHNALLFVFILSCECLAVLYKGDKCSLKDGSEGKCKFMKDCSTALQQIKKGVFPVICGLEKTKSIVCCKNGKNVTNTTPTITNRFYSRTPGDISKQKCKEYAEHAYEKIEAPTLMLYPHFTKRLVCDISRNRLVVGKSLAARREFPHMALIGFKPDDEVKWLCGGSLISENFVLTTAHCLFTDQVRSPKFVRVGFTNKSDLTYMQERAVSEIIPYPAFDYPNIYHDIGLLRLSKNVKFNTYVRPACLQTEKNIPFVSAIASGWEATHINGGQSNNMLATVLEFYSASACNYKYMRIIKPTGKLKDGIVEDLMFCAGISKSVKSICAGDGGGPLQVYHKETKDVKCMYNIIGVISFGSACGSQHNRPHIFTRVSSYIKWIEDIVWPN